MADPKLRRALAVEAARLMYSRAESEYYTAKRKAAKRLCRGPIKPADLPSNAEIRDLIQEFARTYEGPRRIDNLRAMRFRALWLMRKLEKFRPRLIGSVLTGHVRGGSDIDLHLFSDSVGPIQDVLESEGMTYEVERKQVVKHGESRLFTHVHVADDFPFELTVYAENLAHFVFKSSITGKPIERASVRELEAFLRSEYPDVDVDEELADQDEQIDPYQLFRMLLLPLEQVKQNPKWHPEGDALYHTLQVFERAKDVRPWDEEFLLAALLHDVGKGIDRYDHVAAGLQAMDGLISPRTACLIENHMLAHDYRAGTLGAKAKQRLEATCDMEDLMLLEACDMGGRVPGATVGTVDEAITYLRELEKRNQGEPGA